MNSNGSNLNKRKSEGHEDPSSKQSKVSSSECCEIFQKEKEIQIKEILSGKNVPTRSNHAGVVNKNGQSEDEYSIYIVSKRGEWAKTNRIHLELEELKQNPIAGNSFEIKTNAFRVSFNV